MQLFGVHNPRFVLVNQRNIGHFTRTDGAGFNAEAAPPGRTLIFSMSSVSVKTPVFTSAVYAAANDVSIPMEPFGACRKSAFSAGVCGAWSVAMTSIVPSFTASIIARRSFSLRSGGFMR